MRRSSISNLNTVLDRSQYASETYSQKLSSQAASPPMLTSAAKSARLSLESLASNASELADHLMHPHNYSRTHIYRPDVSAALTTALTLAYTLATSSGPRFKMLICALAPMIIGVNMHRQRDQSLVQQYQELASLEHSVKQLMQQETGDLGNAQFLQRQLARVNKLQDANHARFSEIGSSLLDQQKDEHKALAARLANYDPEANRYTREGLREKLRETAHKINQLESMVRAEKAQQMV